MPSSFYNTLLNAHQGTILLMTLIMLVITSIPFNNLHGNFLSWSDSEQIDVGKSSIPVGQDDKYLFPLNNSRLRLAHRCNVFTGKWIPYPRGPRYTNNSKCEIADGQNCMKFGRPDTEFTKWRWKPNDCELPLFDPTRFLELVRGKSMAFIGDSVARNQMESLGCLLSSVAQPLNKSNRTNSRFKHWIYPEYNFTLKVIWTTHLVKTAKFEILSEEPIELYLDEVDESWGEQTKGLDYVILSSGPWFMRRMIYHENGKVVGCHMCNRKNMTELTRFYGYRKALQVAFRKLLDLRSFNGTVILRTITPTHFENEGRGGRGSCVRRRPYKKEETKPNWHLSMSYIVQTEEFRAVEREGRERGLGVKFMLLDITEAMRMRPDGHPNRYGYMEERKKRYNDCLHWCLPGAIDTWNELLLHMLETERPQRIK